MSQRHFTESRVRLTCLFLISGLALASAASAVTLTVESKLAKAQAGYFRGFDGGSGPPEEGFCRCRKKSNPRGHAAYVLPWGRPRGKGRQSLSMDSASVRERCKTQGEMIEQDKLRRSSALSCRANDLHEVFDLAAG
jgi:hypothetical protein